MATYRKLSLFIMINRLLLLTFKFLLLYTQVENEPKENSYRYLNISHYLRASLGLPPPGASQQPHLKTPTRVLAPEASPISNRGKRPVPLPAGHTRPPDSEQPAKRPGLEAPPRDARAAMAAEEPGTKPSSCAFHSRSQTGAIKQLAKKAALLKSKQTKEMNRSPTSAARRLAKKNAHFKEKLLHVDTTPAE